MIFQTGDQCDIMNNKICRGGTSLFQLLIAAAVVVADQLTKYVMVSILPQHPGRTIPIVKGIVHFTYAENKGAAFSILQNQRWFFIALTIAVCAIILYFILSKPMMHILLKISLGLILGGAIGNLIDRIRLGYVVDFIDFRIINYPIFNIADSAVVIGTILLGYYMFFINDAKRSVI